MSRSGVRALLLPWSSALLCAGLWVLATCGGELPGPRVCGGPELCPAAEACVLGRCRSPAKSPVSYEAELQVFEPADVARLSAREQSTEVGESDIIVLGDPDEGESLLLLRFALTLPSLGRLEAAVLRLDPMPSCGAMPADVQLELCHVLSPWRSDTVRWTRRPSLGLPMRATILASTAPRPFRLDVTELVRQWAEHPERYHGLGLLASGAGPGHACFASGLRTARGPRLEIYLTPLPDAGADAGDAGRADGGDASRDAGEGGAGGEAERGPTGGADRE
jgi:hypothetical protein